MKGYRVPAPGPRALALVACLTLVACGGAATPPTAPPTAPPTVRPTVTATAEATATPEATATAEATASAVTPEPTQPATAAPTAVPTQVPTVAASTVAAPTPTLVPTPAPPKASALPAGAAQAYFVDASNLLANASPLTWKVRDLPTGMQAQTIPGAVPGQVSVLLQSDCEQAPGPVTAALEATVAETFVITRLTLAIGPALAPAREGAFVVNAGTDGYSIRRGGPSTLRSGPGLVLVFCKTQTGKTLTALVSQAKIASGLPLSPPPALSLIRVYGWPTPRELQTTGLSVNSVEVAREDAGRVSVVIEPGVYLLVADVSPLVAEGRRPYTVTLSVEMR